MTYITEGKDLLTLFQNIVEVSTSLSNSSIKRSHLVINLFENKFMVSSLL